MISNVYTYYMSQYGNNKTQSKYDTHKKSELRNIYNNIMQSNSRSPFYKVDLSVEAQKFAIDVKENALALSSVLSELSFDEDSTSFKKMAYSSNAASVTAEFVGNNDYNYSDLSIQVDNLATPQVNTGTYLAPNGKDLEPGKYSFDVDIANVTYEFQYAVSNNDTNIDVQSKLMRLINNSNIGLVSSLSTDSLGNNALVISSTSTGSYNDSPIIFSVSDNSSSGNSVYILGLDQTTDFATDAHFYVNGEPRTSAFNEFTLDKAFRIKLNNATDSPVNIGLKADTESMIDNIRNIAAGYNSIIDLASTSKESPSTRKLFGDFSNVVRSYRNVLADNGLTLTEEGKLDINTEFLMEKSEKGTLSSTLEDLKSFNTSLQTKAQNAVIDPMTYANKVIVAYKNPNITTNVPYNTSAYTGMMFDGYL